MKIGKLTFITQVIFSLLINTLPAQKLDENQNYYTTFLNGETKYFDKKTEKIAIFFKDRSSLDQIDHILSQNQIFFNTEYPYRSIRTYDNTNTLSLENIKSFLNSFSSIKWIYPVYQRRDTGTEFILTDEIIIHFNESVSNDLKTKYLQDYNLDLKREMSTGSIVVVVNSPFYRFSLNVVDSLSFSHHVDWIYPNWIQVGVFSSTDPNDPNYDNTDQWALFVVNAGAAWDFRPANTNHDIRIGIIDSGADLDHSDLEDNIVDTWYYYDPPHLINAQDSYGHGTQMAGVSGAVCNNSTFIAGMGWNPGLVIIKWAPGTSGSTEALEAAISWATQGGPGVHGQRTDIINMSFRHESDPQDIAEVIDDAIDENIVVVAATGNNNRDNLDFPASYEPVIAVGVTDKYDLRWEEGSSSGSNYGDYLDLVAPGSDSDAPIVNNYTTDRNNTISRVGGTSYSTALVSGIASLILAANPQLVPDQIEEALTETAVKLEDYTFANGWNEEVGYGMVDAYQAVRYYPPRPTNLTVIADDGHAEINWTDNSNNEDGFKISRQVNGGSWNDGYATLSPNYTFYDDNGISHGNSYNYKVYAYNDGRNSSYSNIDELPYDAWITGPIALGFKDFGTWTANAVGGSKSYSYQWYKKMEGSQNWVTLGASQTETQRMFRTGFDMKVEVDDGNETIEDIHHVYYGIPPKLVAEEKIQIIPEKYYLDQNFPNPFNSSTKINFGLVEDCHVKLDIYNLNGQMIVTLINNFMNAGYHSAVFDASAFASGIYFYKIDAGIFSDLKKMILIK